MLTTKTVLWLWDCASNSFPLPPNWKTEVEGFVSTLDNNTTDRNIIPELKEFSQLLLDYYAEKTTGDVQTDISRRLNALKPKILSKINDPLDFFGQDRLALERPGQGVHDGSFFYSVTTKDGQMACITSDKKFFVKKVLKDGKKEVVYDDIKDGFGLNYTHDFNEEATEYPWKQTDILNFLKDKYTKKTAADLYKKIYDLNEHYVDHVEKGAHAYISCYTMATYCFSLFESFGRIFYNAERGSGKSKQSRINKMLMFNSMWITGITESSLVRNVESTCGTVVVDNFDKLNEEIKQAIHHLIETGLYPDAKYHKTDVDTMQTTSFRTFSPLIINNIYGLDENTIDKCLTINMFATKTAKKDRKMKAKDPIWNQARCDCRHFVLDNWQTILKIYEELDIPHFDGRFLDVVKGPLTIAKLVGDDVYEDLVGFCQNKFNESQQTTVDGDWDYVLFNDIKTQLGGANGWISVFHTAENITPIIKPIRRRDGVEDDADKRTKVLQVCRWIPKTLKTYPFFKKQRLTNGRTEIHINIVDLNIVMERKGYLTDTADSDLSQKHLSALPLSTFSTISTKSTQLYQNDPKSELQVEIGRLSRLSRDGKCPPDFWNIDNKLNEWRQSAYGKTSLKPSDMKFHFDIGDEEMERALMLGEIMEVSPGFFLPMNGGAHDG